MCICYFKLLTSFLISLPSSSCNAAGSTTGGLFLRAARSALSVLSASLVLFISLLTRCLEMVEL